MTAPLIVTVLFFFATLCVGMWIESDTWAISALRARLARRRALRQRADELCAQQARAAFRVVR